MNKILTLAFKPVDYLLGWPDKGEGSEYLQGNYAPVEEEITTHECEVVGKLPEAVAGSFCRNGPNPKFAPTGGYHWFDGDGMIHAVRIKPSGSATYTNRYVRTKKLEAEEEAGRPVAFKMGDLGTRLGFPKMLVSTLKSKLGIHPDFRSMGESVANTSLEFHAGRLLALCEGGLPYHLRVLCEGVIETIGSMSFDGQMKMPFTAHPKKDPSTGKLYSFGYQMDAEPFVTMYVLDAEGKLERQFPVDVGRGVMMHDFAITEKHAIFLDLPLVFKKEKVLTGGFPLEFDKTLGARMGVLSLDAPDSSSIRWFDMPEAFFAFHVLNAWEEKVQVEGSTNTVIKVITCDSFEINLNPEDLTDIADPARLSRPHVTTLNLDTGKATRALVVPPATIEGLDFPQLRRTLVGRKNRFGYFTGFDTKGGMAALVKVDLEASPETAEVARIDLGDWCGGEGLFIPNSGEGVEEDDGFLVTFVSPKDCGKSELRVWDAKTMSPDPVATVKLPARVPLGFHALFVSEEEMATQDQQQQQQ